MGFSKSKKLDKNGESILDRIGDLAKKAETISDADSGGGDTARLRKMLAKVTEELETACDENDRLHKDRVAVKKAFKEAQDELKRAKDAVAKVEKGALKLRGMIKEYGELESGLGKAVDKVLSDMQKIDDMKIEMPNEDFFQ